MVTGFCVAYGGYQELFDLDADLTTYGKGMGGGFPIGVTGGRADIMALFHDKYGPGGIMAGGTFNGNRLSTIAGTAALRELSENRNTFYSPLNARAERLAAEVRAHRETHGFPLQALNAGSMFCFHMQAATIKTYRDIHGPVNSAADAFYLNLLNRGVIIPGIRLCFISGSHKDADVDAIIEAIKDALDDVRRDGLI